jgi:hypothetical protein
MKVVFVIVAVTVIAVLFVLVAPMVDLGPTARLVRATHLLLSLAALLPLAVPRNATVTFSRQLRRGDALAEESLPVVPLIALDCVLLC